MSDITSRPYRPTIACEKCAFNRGPHALFCPWSEAPGEPSTDLYGRLPAPATHCGMTTYISKGQARDRISFISERGRFETEKEWAKRCAVIANVKEKE